MLIVDSVATFALGKRAGGIIVLPQFLPVTRALGVFRTIRGTDTFFCRDFLRKRTSCWVHA